jgi:hypothetical protein
MMFRIELYPNIRIAVLCRAVSFWVLPVLVLLVGCGEQSAPGESAGGPESATGPAMPLDSANFSITPGDRFLWSSYMMSYPVTRDFTGHSYDRPLARVGNPRMARMVDLREAADAGIDALMPCLFMQSETDFHVFGRMVELIEKHDLPIGLSPMFDGFHFPGLTEDDIFEKIRDWFERFAGAECVVKVEGRPVIFTFEAGRLEPEVWERLFGRLRAAGHEGFWVCEGGGAISQNEPPHFDFRAPWFGAFDAGFTFFTNPEAPEPAIRNSREYAERHGADGKPWVGTLLCGYWRPEIANYTSPRGTEYYRKTGEGALRSGSNWIQQATWNDFSENHNIMPGAMKSTTFTELTRYLARDWKDLPNDLEEPRFFLARMHEVQVGEEVLFELLALLPEGVGSAEFRLRIEDASGRVIHQFPARKVEADGLAAEHFEFPVESIPADRMLIPRAELHVTGYEPVTLDGEPTVVSPAGFHPERSFAWIYSPAHRQIANVAIAFSVDQGDPVLLAEQAGGRVKLRVDSPVPLADIEVLHNGMPVHSLRKESPARFPLLSVEEEASLPLTRRGHPKPGFYQVRATTTDQRTAWSHPVFLDLDADAGAPTGHWTFEEVEDEVVFDAGPFQRDARLGGRTRYPEQRPEIVGDGSGGHCALFDGKDDWISMDRPVLPTDRFTVECRIAPESHGYEEAPAVILSSEKGAFRLDLLPDGRLRAGRKVDGEWRWAVSPQAVPLRAWTPVAVHFDGATLTLRVSNQTPVSVEAPGKGAIGRFAIGYRYNSEFKRTDFYHGRIDDVRVTVRAGNAAATSAETSWVPI